METRDIVIFIHGMMLEDRPPLGQAQYERLWSEVSERFPTIQDRVEDTDIIHVEWGKSLGGTRAPDGWVNCAQEHIAHTVDPERVRAKPGPNNMIIPAFGAPPVPAIAWRALAAPLRQVLLVRGLGDMLYYCGEDGKIAVQLAVYKQIFRRIELYRPYFELRLRLHLISHSMGAMIANDLLHGLFAHRGERLREAPDKKRPPSFVTSDFLKEEKKDLVEQFLFWRDLAGERLEVGSIVTLGSPLPLMLMRSQRMVEAFGTASTLSADEIGLSPDGGDILWKNFYDLDDVFAFPVRPLFGEHAAIQDVEAHVGTDPWSHAAYWGNPDVHEKVGELLHRRCVKIPTAV